jgi:hypothetical protein
MFNTNNNIMKNFGIGNKSTGASMKKQSMWANMSTPQRSAMRRTHKDNDRDGVPNKWDCQPNNRMKQDSNSRFKKGFNFQGDEFINIGHLKDEIKNNPDIDHFENLIITIDGDYYYLVVEEWFDDCLESRGYGKTNISSIKQDYKDIMSKETGLRPDIHGYFPNSKLAEYGISFIAEKVNF